MFSARVYSVGFSRYLSGTTTHLAHGLRGSVAVVLPEAEKLVPPPIQKTNQSLGSIIPTGNVVATSKLLGKKTLIKQSFYYIFIGFCLDCVGNCVIK